MVKRLFFVAAIGLLVLQVSAAVTGLAETCESGCPESDQGDVPCGLCCVACLCCPHACPLPAAPDASYGLTSRFASIPDEFVLVDPLPADIFHVPRHRTA